MSVAAAPAVGDRRSRALGSALLMLNQSSQALAYGGIALFLPLIRKDLKLDFTRAGAITAVSTLVYALMQIPSGYLADRIGPKRLFVAGLAGTNVLAFTLAQLHSYWLVLANQAAAGFFRALVFAPGLLLICALFPPHRRATAMGLYVAAGFSSNIFLSSLGPLLVKPLGWRLLFTAFSAAGLVVLAVYSRWGPPAPVRGDAPRVPVREALRIFRYRAMWLLAAIQYVRLAAALGVAVWLPTFIVEDRGRSLQMAGLVVALGSAVTAPSNFLGGYLSDRLQNPLLVIGVSLGVLAVTTALIVHVTNIVLLVGVIVVNAFFVQLYFGPLFAVPIEMLGASAAGLASGFGNAFANLGGFTFAYTLGAVKDSTGSFAIGFYSVAGMCVLGLACTIALSRVQPAGAVA